MPLYKNTFQPFFPDPDSPMPKDCAGDYCYPVAAGDIIMQEWYQTPCAGNMVLDPEFEDVTIGAELLTNGTFTGSAASWTLTGNWSYTSDAVAHTASGSGLDGVTQNAAITGGDFYQVVIVVPTIAQGYIKILLGSGAIQAYISTTGTHTLVIKAALINSEFVIQASSDFVGTVDSASLKAITFANWVPDGTWILSDEMACHSTSGTTDLLYNGTSDYVVAGDYYVVGVTVENYVAGTVTVYIDDGTGTIQTNIQSAISANGEYIYYITASQNGVIGLEANSDFDACISLPTVRRLRNDFFFSLIDAAGDAYDISSTATYTENRININVDMAALLDSGFIADYGCYTIEVTDSCLVSGDNLVQDGDFSNGDFSEWTRNSGAWQYAMTGGEIQFIFDPLGDNPSKVTNGDFSGGATGWTADASWTITAGIGAVHTPGSTTTLSQSITIATPAVAPAVLFTWWQVRITGRTAGSITISVSDRTSGPMTVNNTYTNVMVPTVGGVVTMAITPTSNFDGTVELVAVHEATRSWNSKPIISNPANALVVAGNYQLQYEITGISGTTANTIGGSASIRYPLTGYTYDRSVGIHSHTQDYTPGSTIIEIQGIFDLNSNYYPGTVNIDDYTVVRVEPFEATYVSECLNFQEEHQGTTLVTAWCDQDALGSTTEDALGFDTSGFMLQMRMRCRSLNPVIKTEGNNAFFSDGSSALKYAQIEKYWQFVSDYMSESALTALGGMIRCDHFTIGDDGEIATEYLAEMDDLSPGWLQDGSYNLAPVTINIRKKIGGMKFNRHT